MTVACPHPLWRRDDALPHLSRAVAPIVCEGCTAKAIGKPAIPLTERMRPIAANEAIVSRLLGFLAARGVPVSGPRCRIGWIHDGGECPPMWRIATFDDVGPHARVSRELSPPDVSWPRWLRMFDRWIGRLDGDGDTNLLLVGQEIVAVDWGLAFPWAATGPRDLIRALDDFDVPCHPAIEAASDPETVAVIRSISDEELWFACTSEMASDLIHPALIAAYYTGLRFRRDHLR